jgi:hypothetical protein
MQSTYQVHANQCIVLNGTFVKLFCASHLLLKNVKIRIHKTTVLAVALYGCKPWSLTLREECRLRVYENRVLRKIFGLKSNDVMGGWRKLDNEKHHLYSSPNIIRRIK